MAESQDGFGTSGQSGSPRAWLIFGCAVYGGFAIVMLVAVAGMAIDLARGEAVARSIPIAGVIAVFGSVGAFTCLAKVRSLHGQLLVRRSANPRGNAG